MSYSFITSRLTNKKPSDMTQNWIVYVGRRLLVDGSALELSVELSSSSNHAGKELA
jgi:hypothetical protein